MRALLSALLAAGAAGAAGAQEGPVAPVDCAADGLAPAEIARCAEIAWTESEGRLDLAFGLAVTAAEVLDEMRFLSGETDEVRAAALIETGQAAWLDHRDAHCAAESLLVSEGLEREAVARLCLARLNEARVAQLGTFRGE